MGGVGMGRCWLGEFRTQLELKDGLERRTDEILQVL